VSHHQLGTFGTQEGKPIKYVFPKSQPSSDDIMQNLLSIADSLKKEFRNILLGNSLQVFTDHQNLTYKQFLYQMLHVLVSPIRGVWT
jgi:hypothetical protein